MKWSEFKAYVDGQLAAQGREDADVRAIDVKEIIDGLTAADLRFHLDEEGLAVVLAEGPECPEDDYEEEDPFDLADAELAGERGYDGDL